MKFQVMSRNLPEDHPAPPVSSSGMIIHARIEIMIPVPKERKVKSPR
jgi:hypothetical protein